MQWPIIKWAKLKLGFLVSEVIKQAKVKLRFVVSEVETLHGLTFVDH